MDAQDIDPGYTSFGGIGVNSAKLIGIWVPGSDALETPSGMGAGRIVYQDLAKINLAVEHKTLNQEPVLVEAFQYAKDKNVDVHLLGLVSDGGVHSHTSHLRGLIDATQEFGLQKVFVHCVCFYFLAFNLSIVRKQR